MSKVFECTLFLKCRSSPVGFLKKLGFVTKFSLTPGEKKNFLNEICGFLARCINKQLSVYGPYKCEFFPLTERLPEKSYRFVYICLRASAELHPNKKSPGSSKHKATASISGDAVSAPRGAALQWLRGGRASTPASPCWGSKRCRR